ncbi:hypothetical protein DdX_19106 [Ditylenchus destructor]|uniref:Uncharacterized protein n=1 Tax=Ditylenchus destructor TaxID=166010 RepID=A0AAD4MNQ7_9BILA|nr:hypothetical protein DdX_19106 [Ditylenchus destructor]
MNAPKARRSTLVHSGRYGQIAHHLAITFLAPPCSSRLIRHSSSLDESCKMTYHSPGTERTGESSRADMIRSMSALVILLSLVQPAAAPLSVDAAWWCVAACYAGYAGCVGFATALLSPPTLAFISTLCLVPVNLCLLSCPAITVAFN